MCTDEGSNLLRLFKQVLNIDLVDKFGAPSEPVSKPFDPKDVSIQPIDLFNDSLSLGEEDIVAQQEDFSPEQDEQEFVINVSENAEFSLSMDLDEEIEHYEQRQNFIASRESITLPDLSEDIDTDLTNFDFIDINAEIKRSVAEVENMTQFSKDKSCSI